MWLAGEIQRFDALDGCKGQGPFGCFVDSGVDVLERIPLHREVLLHGPVVYGPQDAQVEGARIPHNPFVVQVGFIHLHHFGIHLVEPEILAVSEVHEAAECGQIGFRGSGLSHLFQPGDELLHEAEERLLPTVVSECADDIVGRVSLFPGIQSMDEFFQAFQIPVDLFVQGEEVIVPGSRRACQRMRFGEPLILENAVVGPELPGNPILNDLIIDPALLAVDGGRPEFHFYTCHTCS